MPRTHMKSAAKVTLAKVTLDPVVDTEATASKAAARKAVDKVNPKPTATPPESKSAPVSKAQPAIASTAAKKHDTSSPTSSPEPRNPIMNEQFTRQAQDMFKVAGDARIPENMQAFAEDSVNKTRDAYHKINTVAKDGAKVVEEVVSSAQAGAKAIGDKVLHNATVNTESLFDAAQAIARARTLPEAARLQADFMQQQFAAAGAQTKELFELSSKIARQTLESMNSAASKSFEQMKR